MSARRFLPRLCRRLCPAALFVVAACIASLAPAGAQEGRTIRLAVGASSAIALSENPSTGYRWQLDGAASRNLALISVSDAGFTSGASGRLGAPGTRRFSITGRQPGTAVAVFDYARPWERVAPARRYVVTVEVVGR
jgi:inhibitor of cysteine peptidase